MEGAPQKYFVINLRKSEDASGPVELGKHFGGILIGSYRVETRGRYEEKIVYCLDPSYIDSSSL